MIGGRPYDLSYGLAIVFDEKNIDCTYEESGKMTKKVLWKVSSSMGLFSLFLIKESD